MRGGMPDVRRPLHLRLDVQAAHVVFRVPAEQSRAAPLQALRWAADITAPPVLRRVPPHGSEVAIGGTSRGRRDYR